MKILIMGGTLFLGRAVIDGALARGHEVAMFNRGRTNPDLFPDVEHVVGDRDGDLAPLRGSSFDAVIDTSAYYPRQVHAVVAALDDIGHYSLVSSMSVYADHSIPFAGEDGPLETIDDPSVEELGEKYGGFKALCEAALDEALPGRGHHVRAGLIVGPHDNTGRFTYWVKRIAEGGTVLAPEPQDQPVQFIDVRDLADWILLAAENNVTGPVNANGIAGQLTMADLLNEIVAITNSAAELQWVDEDFLFERDVSPWQDLPLWLPPKSMPTHAGFMLRDVSTAAGHGMTLRPVGDTISATLDFLRSGGNASREKDFGNAPQQAGLAPDREARLLEEWSAASARA